MNRTINYALCQWGETDRVQRTDFNEDNVKLDTAVKAVERRVDGLDGSKASASALNALAGRVAALEQPRFYVGTYTGDGNESRTIQLPWAPTFMILFSTHKSDEAVIFLTPDHRAYVINDRVDTESQYLPEIIGSSLVFSNNWANTSNSDAWYIMFR